MQQKNWKFAKAVFVKWGNKFILDWALPLIRCVDNQTRTSPLWFSDLHLAETDREDVCASFARRNDGVIVEAVDNKSFFPQN